MNFKGIRWKTLIGAIVLPLITGFISFLLTMGGMKKMGELNQPPLSPPSWLFPIVWTILYIVMGVASYLVIIHSDNEKLLTKSLKVYLIQLFFNFMWSIFFFALELYTFAFLWLIVLFALISVTAVRFYKIDPRSAYLLIPYLVWVAFAGYLNLGVAILN